MGLIYNFPAWASGAAVDEGPITLLATWVAIALGSGGGNLPLIGLFGIFAELGVVKIPVPCLAEFTGTIAGTIFAV